MVYSLIALAAGVLALTIEPAAAAGNARQGMSTAKQYCALCHAIGKKDKSPRPDVFPLREMSKRYPVEDLEEALAEGLFINHPEMPEIVLDGDQVNNFIAYLKSIQKR